MRRAWATAGAELSTPRVEAAPPCTKRVETETPGVAEEVQHTLPAAIAGHGPAVLALIAVEPCLLPGGESHLVGDVILDDGHGLVRDPADDLDVLAVESFLRGDRAVGPGDEPLGAREFHQVPEQHLATAHQGEAREVSDQPAVIAVDDQAGEAVAFAEDEPVGVLVASQVEHFRPQPEGRLELCPPEDGVQWLIVPAVQPHEDRARGVVQPACNEDALWLATSTSSPGAGEPSTLATE